MLDFLNPIIWFMNNVLYWVLLYLLLWNAWILIFNKGVPNIRTAPAIRRKIIALLKKEAEGRNGFTVMDLGSGNGLFTREIARALPHAKVIGFEISGKALKWSMLLKKIFRLETLEYRKEDFFKADLSEADAVVFYLTVYEMGRMGEKLQQNLKPGTLITSNRFKLGGWEPLESIRVRTLYPHQRTFHVYRKA